METSQTTPATGHEYVVVARRYRPQTFEELIGQEHVAKALSNAIAGNRVGHAYLFTGARGVGKTSAARILAKALNCVEGPTAKPCNRCDLCQSISTGEDVDVLEIDGASNRGIDEIRQLRQNVNVRPSRSRFKIYIIDEVHMLTREAFNALLKTLEEPPEHVKFIFCTTEATKIPITILSRCQRFDFAGIQTNSIAERLRQIVEAEGVEAEPEAIDTLARRAAGSMRDSQSLLEQLLSFSSGRITAADVHAMLGTAADEALEKLVGHLIDRNAAEALAQFDAAVAKGVDPGLLLEQLLGYLRDCMVSAVGAPPETLIFVSPAARAALVESSKRLGLQTILAAMQILDQTLARMRYSTQGRVLAELALVRISQLENLDDLANLIAQLQSSAPAAPAAAPSSAPAKKKSPPAVASAAAEPEGDPPPSSAPQTTIALSAETAASVWLAAAERLSGMAANYGKQFDRVVLVEPNLIEVVLKPEAAMGKAFCERAEQMARLEAALAETTGQKVRVRFTVAEAPKSAEPAKTAPAVSRRQRENEIRQNPFYQRAAELFGAELVRFHDPNRDDN